MNADMEKEDHKPYFLFNGCGGRSLVPPLTVE
jgi:hypothetical protein